MQLLECADKALYAAKNKGRNRVVYVERGHVIAHRRSTAGTPEQTRIRDQAPLEEPPRDKPPVSGKVVDLIIRD